jgi:hypothetical protein
MHEEGGLGPYEVCSEDVPPGVVTSGRVVSTVPNTRATVEQPSRGSCPEKFCCLRIYSAARFRNRLFVKDDRECYEEHQIISLGCLLVAKPLRAYPQLSQISEVVFVCTRYQVFLPTFYTQPVLPRR